MEKNYKENLKYRSAKKKVKDIKGFYVHLLVYLFINVAIIAVTTYKDWEELGEIWTYSTAFFWGIGLFAHWFSVFGPNVLFGKDWEEKKIQELMERKKRNTWE